MKVYDLAIVGAGSAGAVVAKIASSAGLSVLVLEKGKSLNERKDPACGWFGHALTAMDRMEASGDLFNAPESFKKALEICREANGGKLELKKGKSGSSGAMKMIESSYYRFPSKTAWNLAQSLFKGIRGDVLFDTHVKRVSVSVKGFSIRTVRGRFVARKCLLASGGKSAEWLFKTSKDLGIVMKRPTARFGVRVEFPAKIANTLINEYGDIKHEIHGVLIDDLRMNGIVGEWEDFGLLSAYAHHPIGKCSVKRSNFFASVDAGDFEELLRVARIINVLSNDKIRRERVFDILNGQTVMRHFGQFDEIAEALTELPKMFPRFTGSAMAYAPEVRMGGALIVDSEMRTACPGLYGAGHCTDRVVTLLGALASGIKSAHSILKDEGK